MKVICYGDSNTYGYDPSSLWGEAYPEGSCWTDILRKASGWDIQNEGMNGREIPNDSVVFPIDTDWVIIMLGTNDLLQFWTSEDAAAKMKCFLLSLAIPPEKILLIAPPTMQLGEWVQDQELIDDSVRLAEEYRKLSAELNIRFMDAGKWDIPLAYDGVHLTLDGHRIFAERLLAEWLKIT